MDFLSSPVSADRLCGPLCPLSNAYFGLFPGVQRPGRGTVPPLLHTSSWHGT